MPQNKVSTDTTINHFDDTGQADTVGPVLYLLKLIVRQYGFPCLAEVSTEHTWVVPPELRKADEVTMTTEFNEAVWCSGTPYLCLTSNLSGTANG